MLASIHEHKIPEQQRSCKCKGVPRQRMSSGFCYFLKGYTCGLFPPKKIDSEKNNTNLFILHVFCNVLVCN